MKKSLLILIVLLLVTNLNLFSQNKKHYIDRGVFTKIVSVSSVSNHGDDILNVNVFYKMGEKVSWGESNTIISYKYLGIDNDNNLLLEREQYDEDRTDKFILTFALDSNNSGIITLIGQRSQKNPLLLKLKVSCSNNQIITEYLGKLPDFNE